MFVLNDLYSIYLFSDNVCLWLVYQRFADFDAFADVERQRGVLAVALALIADVIPFGREEVEHEYSRRGVAERRMRARRYALLDRDVETRHTDRERHRAVHRNALKPFAAQTHKIARMTLEYQFAVARSALFVAVFRGRQQLAGQEIGLHLALAVGQGGERNDGRGYDTDDDIELDRLEHTQNNYFRQNNHHVPKLDINFRSCNTNLQPYGVISGEKAYICGRKSLSWRRFQELIHSVAGYG